MFLKKSWIVRKLLKSKLMFLLISFMLLLFLLGFQSIEKFLKAKTEVSGVKAEFAMFKVKDIKVIINHEKKENSNNSEKFLGRLPEKINNFIGREKEIKDISTYFVENSDSLSTVLVTGFSGSGKTQLGYQVINKCFEKKGYDHYDHVVFIDCRNIQKSFAGMFDDLELSGTCSSLEKKAERVKDELNKYTCFYVFREASSEKVISDWLPKVGHVFITSTNGNRDDWTCEKVFPLPFFKKEEKCAFLEKSPLREELIPFIDLLPDHPGDFDKTVTHLEKQEKPVEEFFDLYGNNTPISNTIKEEFEKIKEKINTEYGNKAIEILNIITKSNLYSISRKFIADRCGEKSMQGIGLLQSKSFIQLDKSEKNIIIYRYAHERLRRILLNHSIDYLDESKNVSECTEEKNNYFKGAFPSITKGRKFENEKYLRDCLSNIKRLRDEAVAKKSYEEAKNWGNKCIRYTKELHKYEAHVDVREALHEAAEIEDKTCNFLQSLDYEREALSMSKRLDGDIPHYDTANCLNRVGVDYCYLGDFKLGLNYYKQSSSICRNIEKNLKTVPDSELKKLLAKSLSNTSYACTSLGYFEKARINIQEALSLFKGIGETADDSFIDALETEGYMQFELGKFGDALNSFEKAYEKYKKSHNFQDKLRVAACLTKIGMSLCKLGRFTEASEKIKDAYDILVRLYPNKDDNISETHVESAKNLDWNGVIFRNKKNPGKALEYHLKAFGIYEKVYKEIDHPYVILCLNNIGLALHELGEIKGAICKFEEAADICNRLYPEKTHFHLARTLDNLGMAFYSLKDSKNRAKNLEKSEHYHSQALEIYEKVYTSNPNHSDLIKCLTHIGLTQYESKNYKSATDSFKKAHKHHGTDLTLKFNEFLKEIEVDAEPLIEYIYGT